MTETKHIIYNCVMGMDGEKKYCRKIHEAGSIFLRLKSKKGKTNYEQDNLYYHGVRKSNDRSSYLKKTNYAC